MMVFTRTWIRMYRGMGIFMNDFGFRSPYNGCPENKASYGKTTCIVHGLDSSSASALLNNAQAGRVWGFDCTGQDWQS